MKKENKNNSIIIYTDKKSGVKLETHLENESIWLTQKQMSGLFNKNVRTVNDHIENVFKEKELNKKSVIRNIRITGSDGKNYNVNHYNLDVIISVGYRVKSLEGTKFRIWATNILKKHIVDGYTINEVRLLEAHNNFKELQQAINLLQEVSKKKSLSGQNTEDILNILSKYSKALNILDEYDRESFKEIKGTKSKYKLSYKECLRIVDEFKKGYVEDSEKEVFALEKDNSFKSVINNLYQTYNGKELYKTTEEKAANLLYLVTKDHSFIGGNKRVASVVFAYFLEKTGISNTVSGERRINDSGLVALTLLIAESNPKDKDLLIKMIKNLLV